MEKFNNQMWKIIKNHLKYFSSDLKYSKFNRTLQIPEEFLTLQNITNWKDFQSFIQFYYNRSIHLYLYKEGNIDQDCHPFGNIFEVIYSYYLPSMIFIGLVGNLLSCVVFLNTHLKMRSSSYYLAALACADFGFLTSLFLVWLNGMLEIPLFNIEGYCQCIVYISSVCSFLSVWLIAAFTVERFIAVQYPLRRPHMCTVARAKAIVIYLLCISLTVHTYVFVTSGIIKLDDGSEVCEMLEKHREAMRVINIIDSILTLIIPLVLIVVINFLIICNLIKFNKKFKKLEKNSKMFNRRKSNINLDFFESITKSWSNNDSRKIILQNASNSSCNDISFQKLSQLQCPIKIDVFTEQKFENIFYKKKKCIKINVEKKLISTRSQQSFTKLLLLISSVFVLLNLPSYGIRLYVFIFFSVWAESPPVLLWCLQQTFMVLYYTNFSINFLLYSMCGITFRRCLWQLVRNKLKKNF